MQKHELENAIGRRVKVSNGQPRPPERFNRKLSDWKHDNFTGILVEVSVSNYSGRTMAKILESENSFMVIFRHVHAENVTEILEGEPVKNIPDAFALV